MNWIPALRPPPLCHHYMLFLPSLTVPNLLKVYAPILKSFTTILHPPSPPLDLLNVVSFLYNVGQLTQPLWASVSSAAK